MAEKIDKKTMESLTELVKEGAYSGMKEAIQEYNLRMERRERKKGKEE